MVEMSTQWVKMGKKRGRGVGAWGAEGVRRNCPAVLAGRTTAGRKCRSPIFRPKHRQC